ncbi:MAG: iron-sulfur cluster assembly accessory protein [Burkholderiales bacterium]|jgi:iron-sulfur cluster assembly protein
MAIQLTQKAAKHICNALASKGGLGLRLGIKSVGCSGLAYTFDYATEIGANDETFESYGAKVVVDRKDLAFVDGSTLDYERQGLNEVFKVNNPKAVGVCGCGESFTVESAA